MKLQSLDRSVITSVSVKDKKIEKVSLTCDEAVQKKAQLLSLKQGIVQSYLKGIEIKTDIDLYYLICGSYSKIKTQ